MHFLEIDVDTEVLQLKHPFYRKRVKRCVVNGRATK